VTFGEHVQKSLAALAEFLHVDIPRYPALVQYQRAADDGLRLLYQMRAEQYGLFVAQAAAISFKSPGG
jgi:hypothetical protein